VDVEVRGSFEFDANRAELALRLNGQDKLKVEHVWINQKAFHYGVAGQLQPVIETQPVVTSEAAGS
jgi:hypothetical protein